jgi:hypothetical protein
MVPAFSRNHGKLDFLIERQKILCHKSYKHNKSLFLGIKREKISLSAFFRTEFNRNSQRNQELFTTTRAPGFEIVFADSFVMYIDLLGLTIF